MAAYAKPTRPSRLVRQRLQAVLRADGCTCDPDVRIVRWISDEIHHVAAAHDETCPAAGLRRQLVTWPRSS